MNAKGNVNTGRRQPWFRILNYFGIGACPGCWSRAISQAAGSRLPGLNLNHRCDSRSRRDARRVVVFDAPLMNSERIVACTEVTLSRARDDCHESVMSVHAVVRPESRIHPAAAEVNTSRRGRTDLPNWRLILRLQGLAMTANPSNLMGEFNGGFATLDGYPERPLLSAILEEGNLSKSLPNEFRRRTSRRHH